MTVTIPEGGWTEDNLPEEFLGRKGSYHCILNQVSNDSYRFRCGAADTMVAVKEVLWYLKINDLSITHIIKPNKKENQMNENIKALHAVLKPFVRVKTRGKGTYIYHGVRRDRGTCYHGEHHAYTPSDGFQAWENEDLTCDENSLYDVVEVFDFPPLTYDMLDPDRIGPSLWKREERDPHLASLENSLKEAQKALEEYKKGKVM